MGLTAWSDGKVAGIDYVEFYRPEGRVLMEIESESGIAWIPDIDVIAFIGLLKRPEVAEKFPEIAEALKS